MSRSLALLLALALSVAGFQVTQPNSDEGWTSNGPNTLAWERVDTDPTNFTVILTNVDRSVLPENNQLLAAAVDAVSQSSLTISAPSGGFPVGGSFRVNLVRSQTEPDAILAQSDEFEITAGGATSTSGTSTVTGTTTGATTGTTTRGGSTITAPNPSGTTTDLNPSGTPTNAAGSISPQGGMMGALLVLGALLA